MSDQMNNTLDVERTVPLTYSFSKPFRTERANAIAAAILPADRPVPVLFAAYELIIGRLKLEWR